MKKELSFGIVASLIVIIAAFVFFINAGEDSPDNTANTNFTNTTDNSDRTNTTSANQNSAGSNGTVNSQETNSVTLTLAEVAQHDTSSDCWIIIQNSVYDVTSFISSHPGGAERIISVCGTDATTAFQTQGGEGSHSSLATRELAELLLGTVNSTIGI